MKIGGLQKLTLLDYPGKLASTVFTSGCSFKCPFCHNKELVFVPENYSFLDTEKVLSYLAKRKNLLDGICITGGEPLLQEGLLPFIEAVKEMGYFVKLDTNGNNPEKLNQETIELYKKEKESKNWKELLMRKKALMKYVRLLRRQPLWKKLL